LASGQFFRSLPLPTQFQYTINADNALTITAVRTRRGEQCTFAGSGLTGQFATAQAKDFLDASDFNFLFK
jgi:hypothetical protein